MNLLCFFAAAIALLGAFCLVTGKIVVGAVLSAAACGLAYPSLWMKGRALRLVRRGHPFTLKEYLMIFPEACKICGSRRIESVLWEEPFDYCDTLTCGTFKRCCRCGAETGRNYGGSDWVIKTEIMVIESPYFRHEKSTSIRELDLRNEQTRELLENLLRCDDSIFTRPSQSWAVECLAAHFRDEESRALLTDLARHARDTSVQSQAVRSLAEHFCDHEIRVVLTELARGGLDMFVQRQAVASLVEHFRDGETHELLVELVRRTEQTLVRSKAIWALVEYFHDSPMTVETLRGIMAGEHGRQSIENNFFHRSFSVDARAFLQSFLKSGGESQL